LNYHQYEPGNGTRYTLWVGSLESPHFSECANILIWQDAHSLKHTIFTFPTGRDARVSDITDKLEGDTVFQGDVAAIAGFVKCEMNITMNDTEGQLSEYDIRGRWVG